MLLTCIDICLDYLRVGEERMLEKRGFRLITLVCVFGGGENDERQKDKDCAFGILTD